MSDAAIVVEGLSKRYLVGHQSARLAQHLSFREMMTQEARNFARKAVDLVHGRQVVQGDEVEEFWALKDVSFEVKQGEVLGVVGRNGAGKSTLLKVLSQITEPTEGRVLLRGRVASLLEVGTGFHPELTGRENIFLNGAILGMTQREIRGKFDEIVAFAEVDRFLDTPVKRYSSGMYVRLAFAVAAHLEPEILIVDEVLAVGDAEFQKKCLGKMSEVAGGGRTVLFVSHNLAAVEALCDTCVGLDHGTIFQKGSAVEVISSYGKTAQKIRGEVDLTSITNRQGRGLARFARLYLTDASGNQIDCAKVGQHLEICLEISGIDTKRRSARLGLSFSTATGALLFICATETIPGASFTVGGGDIVRTVIPNLPLGAGHYQLGLFLECNGVVDDWIVDELELQVMDGDFFGSGRNAPQGWDGRSVLVKHHWAIDRADRSDATNSASVLEV
jgi:lipopolysaccharide transport system ATP-binding protein